MKKIPLGDRNNLLFSFFLFLLLLLFSQNFVSLNFLLYSHTLHIESKRTTEMNSFRIFSISPKSVHFYLLLENPFSSYVHSFAIWELSKFFCMDL